MIDKPKRYMPVYTESAPEDAERRANRAAARAMHFIMIGIAVMVYLSVVGVMFFLLPGTVAQAGSRAYAETGLQRSEALEQENGLARVDSWEIGEDGVLTVTLGENEASSFRWNYGVSREDVLEYIPERSRTYRDGNNRWEVCFRAGKNLPEEVTLTFYYMRSIDEAPVDKRVLTVRVDGDGAMDVAEL